MKRAELPPAPGGRGRRRDVADEPRVPHTARIKPDIKDEIETEAPLRGHTASEATEIALALGMPLYKKRYKRKFAPVAS